MHTRMHCRCIEDAYEAGSCKAFANAMPAKPAAQGSGCCSCYGGKLRLWHFASILALPIM